MKKVAVLSCFALFFIVIAGFKPMQEECIFKPFLDKDSMSCGASIKIFNNSSSTTINSVTIARPGMTSQFFSGLSIAPGQTWYYAYFLGTVTVTLGLSKTTPATLSVRELVDDGNLIACRNFANVSHPAITFTQPTCLPNFLYFIDYIATCP